MTGVWSRHGGALAAARRTYGEGRLPWLDLSTGINPHPWPGAADVAVDWQRLPDASALTDLETAAASAFGVDPRFVCAVPGTEIGLRLTGHLIGGPARHIAPAYRTHGEMVAEAASIGWDDVANHAGTLILANPNNPDGRVVEPGALRALLDTRDRDGWLLVDEAFADGDPAIGMAAHIGEASRLILFRSFGKFFGLAGVRLGFVLGPQKILVPLRRLLGAWPLSAAAIAIGTAAYRDGDWIAATRQRLPGDAAALDAVLLRCGYRPVGGCPLFRLIETPDAHALFERLARAAILSRPFAERRDWLRIGLPADAAARTRLEAALTDG